MEYTRFIIFLLTIVFVFFGLIILAFILYHVAKTVSVKRLGYKRYFSKEGVYANEPVELIEELSNHSIFPMFLVDVETHITSQIFLKGAVARDEINQYFISRFSFIPPFTSITRTHEAKALKRGFYQLESARIHFAKMELDVSSVASLHVYPKPVSIETARFLNKILQYDSPSHFPILTDPFLVRGIREFATGDRLHNINFKASARHQKFLVNETEYLLGRRLQIYLNFQVGEKMIRLSDYNYYMEQALEHIAYLIYEASSHGYEVGFSCNARMVNGDHYLRFKKNNSPDYYTSLLSMLSEVRMVSGNSFASIINMDLKEGICDSEIFLFSFYLDDVISDQISRLRQMGNSLEFIPIHEHIQV